MMISKDLKHQTSVYNCVQGSECVLSTSYKTHTHMDAWSFADGKLIHVDGHLKCYSSIRFHSIYAG